MTTTTTATTTTLRQTEYVSFPVSNHQTSYRLDQCDVGVGDALFTLNKNQN